LQPKVNTEMRTSEGGWTPLHVACKHQSRETVDILIKKGESHWICHPLHALCGLLCPGYS